MDPTPALDRTDPATRPPDADPFEPAALAGCIGRFALLRQLGAGAMGVVYAAYDEELDRRVAIKLLHAGAGDSEGRGRILREAQAMARVSHPQVVQIYEVGVHASRVFVAMEFVDGPTLAAWQQSAARTPAEILALYIEAGEGLAAAHAAGLVHRDFKPDNVLVGKDGRVRVGDFGLARAQDPAGASTPASEPPATSTLEVASPALASTARIDRGSNLLLSPLTLVGAVVGTPAYMSAEQLQGAPLDARSDQFSFCAALYEALYGQRPFAGETLHALMASVLTGSPRPPPPGLAAPPWLFPLLRRGLARDPAHRFTDMHALLVELGRDDRRDPRQGATARRRFAVVMIGTIVITSVMLVRGEFVDAAPVDKQDIVRVAALATGAIVFGVLLFGRELLRNHFHRAVLTIAVLAASQMLLVRLTLVDADTPIEVILRVDCTINTVLSVAGALLVARWFWWVAAPLATGAVISLVAPGILLYAVQILYPLFVIAFLVGWNRGARTRQPSSSHPASG